MDFKMILKLFVSLAFTFFVSCSSTSEEKEDLPEVNDEDRKAQNAKWQKSASEARAENKRLNQENILHNKGTVLATSPSMKADPAKFKKIYDGALKGDRDYQYSLAMCYKYGYGVTTDRKKALFWFKKSADQGNKQAERVYKYMIIRK